MAHTNVQLVSGNLTTGGEDPTFYVDRVNNMVGIGGVPDTSGDDSTNVLQITGSVLATKYHGDGSSLTGLNDSKWLEYSSDASKIYYNGGNVGIGEDDPDSKLVVNGDIDIKNGTLKTNGTDPIFSNWATDTNGINRTGNVGIGGGASATNALKVHGTVEAATVKAQTRYITGIAQPYQDTRLNTNDLSVGWYRIAENGNAVNSATSTGSRCSARFTIMDYTSGQHSTRTLYAGGTYGQNPFIHLLTNTSYSSGGVISKVRVVEDNTYEGLAVEVYVDYAVSANQVRIVMDDNYQSTGFTLINFESVPADHDGMNEYEIDLDSYIWGIHHDGTQRISLDTDGNVGIGTTDPGYKLVVNGTSLFSGEMRWGLGHYSYAGYSTNKDWYIRSGSSSGKVIIQDTGGNVGVGTASPAAKFHVHDSDGVSGWRDFYVRPTSLWGDGLTTASETAGTKYMTMNMVMLQAPHITPSSTGQNAYIRYGRAGGIASGKWWETACVTDGSFRIRREANDSYGVTINSSGHVGIGTTSPGCQLHVSGYSNINIGSGSRQWFIYNTTDPSTRSSGTGTWGYASIYASWHIAAGGSIASVSGVVGASDERIKKDIIDVDDGSALETLRLLKPKQYKYKDYARRGSEPVWGFIAQEVRETLPYATTIKSDSIPNIYELVTVSNSNVITFTNFDTSTLVSNASVLKIFDVKEVEHMITINEVIDEHTIRVEEDLSEWIASIDETGNVVAGNQLFVYGQEVDDFIYLKKEAIFTVATAALQEVDRQLQAEKARNDALEARITALENA